MQVVVLALDLEKTKKKNKQINKQTKTKKHVRRRRTLKLAGVRWCVSYSCLPVESCLTQADLVSVYW